MGINFINIEFFFNLILRFFESLALILSGVNLTGSLSFKIFSSLFSLVFLVGIFYAFFRTRTIERLELAKIYQGIDDLRFKKEETLMSQKWQDIVGHLDNVNINSWAIAIIEADKMLDTALAEMGFYGESLGEKLKSMSAGELPSINNAWEAHKLRNRIAHETDFVLTHKEAREAVRNYETVLKDLDYI